jgi:hypothetical protein
VGRGGGCGPPKGPARGAVRRIGTTQAMANKVRGRGGIMRLGGMGYRVLPAVGLLSGMSAVDSFAANLDSFARNVVRGDSAYALLDAISAAVDFQTIGGDYFATYALLDALLEIEAGE